VKLAALLGYGLNRPICFWYRFHKFVFVQPNLESVPKADSKFGCTKTNSAVHKFVFVQPNLEFAFGTDSKFGCTKINL
jgi:hypothetical protein